MRKINDMHLNGLQNSVCHTLITDNRFDNMFNTTLEWKKTLLFKTYRMQFVKGITKIKPLPKNNVILVNNA